VCAGLTRFVAPQKSVLILIGIVLTILAAVFLPLVILLLPLQYTSVGA
jgi:hypothetical protein